MIQVFFLNLCCRQVDSVQTAGKDVNQCRDLKLACLHMLKASIAICDRYGQPQVDGRCSLMTVVVVSAVLNRDSRLRHKRAEKFVIMYTHTLTLGIQTIVSFLSSCLSGRLRL